MSELQIEGQELKVGKAVAWELTAEELIYPYTLKAWEKTKPIFVHMRPYKTSDMKAFLTDSASAVKMDSDDNSELVKSKPEKIDAFFWKHFIRLSSHGGAETTGDPTLEQQKQWIRDHPRFDIPNIAVYDGGFTGIAIKDQGLFEGSDSEVSANGNGYEEVELDIFQMDLEPATGIQLNQKLCLPNVGVVMLEMEHSFRRESASEYQRYQRGTNKALINRKLQAYQNAINYEVVDQIYESLIDSVDGMTIKGEACTSANKDVWVKLIPFWHKHIALREFFSGVQSKNG